MNKPSLIARELRRSELVKIARKLRLMANEQYWFDIGHGFYSMRYRPSERRRFLDTANNLERESCSI